MDNPVVLEKRSSRASYFIILAIMCCAILLVITAAYKNNILRDKFVFSNTITDITGLIFLTVLFGFAFSKPEKANKPVRAFKLFVILVFCTVFFAALSVCFYGLPGNAVLITVLVTISYCFSASFYSALWGYQKQYYKNRAKTGIITVLLASAAAAYITTAIINIFHPILFNFTPQGLFDGTVVDYASFVMNGFCIAVLSVAAFSSDLALNKKKSFVSFLLIPSVIAALNFISYFMRWYVFLPSMTDVAMILCLYTIFFNLHIDLENEIIKREKEQLKLQFAATISQIQPHFVYNSLSVIAALCEEDPHLASQAADTFSDYLRENIDFAGKSKPVSFSEELKHIKTYVWLEQLRFPNKLKTEYNINCTSFFVPALSVQPLVENAIKHGICKSKTGGTVTISSFEDDHSYIISVSDDGVGFDVSKTIDDGKMHVGIENARFRIKEMFKGSMDIESCPGEGTRVTIKIPKERKNHENNYGRG